MCWWRRIPSPARGELHFGFVGPFELSDSPAWAQEYLQLRASQKLSRTPEEKHIGDVVQGWPVPQGFTRVPFAADEVWEGNTLSEGLFRDWASWQREDGSAFAQLRRVLEALSPSPSEMLEPGELRKISIQDPKRHPTIKRPGGQEVALLHSSAGIRRVVALAYLLVWTWQEHLAACELIGTTPASFPRCSTSCSPSPAAPTAAFS